MFAARRLAAAVLFTCTFFGRRDRIAAQTRSPFVEKLQGLLWNADANVHIQNSGKQCLVAPCGEKIRQQTSALVSEHTADDLGVVVETSFGKKIRHAAGDTGFRVART